MIRIKTKLLLIVVLFMFVLPSCAMVDTTKKTPKQQATIWMDIYYAQYRDTAAIMINPNSTKEQKDFGRKKREILIQVWPLLKAYVAIVDSGGVPSVEDEMAINDLIDQLVNLIL